MKYSGWLLLLIPLIAMAQSVHQSQNQETGIKRWQWQSQGLSLQQVQLLPDQIRAFFLGRGFSREDAEHIAAMCVFQTIFSNQGKQPVALDLAQWQAVINGKAKPLKLTADWQQDWEARNSPEAARIAFQWSLFPNIQQFEPGDWNMGMITYPVPPGTAFDLHFSWQSDDVPQQAVLPDLHCAKDEDPLSQRNQ